MAVRSMAELFVDDFLASSDEEDAQTRQVRSNTQTQLHTKLPQQPQLSQSNPVHIIKTESNDPVESTLAFSTTGVSTASTSSTATPTQHPGRAVYSELLENPNLSALLSRLEQGIQQSRQRDESEAKSQADQIISQAQARLAKDNSKNKSKEEGAESDSDSTSNTESDTDSDTDSDSDAGLQKTSSLPAVEISEKMQAYDPNTLQRALVLSTEIENEITRLAARLKDIFGKWYPELAEHFSEPEAYASVMLLIIDLFLLQNQNEPSVAGLTIGTLPGVKELLQALPGRITDLVSDTAAHRESSRLVPLTLSGCSLSSSSALSSDDLTLVRGVAEAIIHLEKAKKTAMEFQTTHMAKFLPNLSALLGATLAAELLVLTGGLRALLAIAPSNLQVVGARRGAGHRLRSQEGSFAEQQHMGILAGAAPVQQAPPELRRRCVRQVANKAALAARADAAGTHPLGQRGAELLEEIFRRLKAWEAPPPSRVEKALPVPGSGPKKRRGGRRYRAEKERTRQTEIMKQRNRMAFGVAEITDHLSGEGFGLLGQAGAAGPTGRLQAEDNQHIKTKGMSRAMKERLKHAGANVVTKDEIVYGGEERKDGTGGGAGAGAGAEMSTTHTTTATGSPSSITLAALSTTSAAVDSNSAAHSRARLYLLMKQKAEKLAKARAKLLQQATVVAEEQAGGVVIRDYFKESVGFGLKNQFITMDLHPQQQQQQQQRGIAHGQDHAQEPSPKRIKEE